MPELSLTLLDFAIVTLAGFAAGFVDSIAGGGGLISMPTLLSIGVPPHLALGTNKLQSALGTSFAAANYARRGLVSREGLSVGIIVTALAASTGAWAVTRVSADFLVHLIPWLLTGIFLYVLVSPTLGEERRRARLGVVVFHVLFGLGLGFYDGFFGPGTGSFWTLSYVLLLGLTLPYATGNTKVMNVTSNVASLAWFAWNGDVAWLIGVGMGAANIAGSLTGSTLAIRGGVKFIRMFVLIAVGATIIRLLWASR